VAVSVALTLVFTTVVYRIVFRCLPVEEGVIRTGTRALLGYHVYALFHLFVFYPALQSGLIPIPLIRLAYLALGARLGRNTYPAGQIVDPPFTSVGHDTIIGQNALLGAHLIVGDRLRIAGIRVGDNVTIGAGAMIGPGVVIADGAVISAGAILCPRVVVGADAMVAPGVVVKAGARIAPGDRVSAFDGASATDADRNSSRKRARKEVQHAAWNEACLGCPVAAARVHANTGLVESVASGGRA
jgi:acetyltransferase-like isoleucine patch superfamily enzyme